MIQYEQSTTQSEIDAILFKTNESNAGLKSKAERTDGGGEEKEKENFSSKISKHVYKNC